MHGMHNTVRFISWEARAEMAGAAAQRVCAKSLKSPSSSTAENVSSFNDVCCGLYSVLCSLSALRRGARSVCAPLGTCFCWTSGTSLRAGFFLATDDSI